MKCIKFDFTPWLIYDKYHNCLGISDDAPQEAKDEYKRITEPHYENGILIK